MPSSWCPMKFAAHYAENVGRRGKKLFADWQSQFDEYAKKYPDLAREWQQMRAPRAARRVGASPACVSRRCQRIGHPRFLGQSAQRRGPADSLAVGWGGRPGAFDHDAPGHSTLRACSHRPSRAATCTSAFASTAWRPPPTAWRYRTCGPMYRRSSCSATTCGRRCGWRRSWSCR